VEVLVAVEMLEHLVVEMALLVQQILVAVAVAVAQTLLLVLEVRVVMEVLVWSLFDTQIHIQMPHLQQVLQLLQIQVDIRFINGLHRVQLLFKDNKWGILQK
jgi:nanoRNase/pAp phosphatase (c-di-AMP/oligoRNAs hydrolase)